MDTDKAARKEGAAPAPSSARQANENDSGGVLRDLIDKKRKSDALSSPAAQAQRPATPPLTLGQQRTVEKARQDKYSPPKKSNHEGKLIIADDGDIIAKMEADGFGEHVGSRSQAEVILRQMYGRGFLEGDDNRDRRVEELKKMVNPSETCIHERAIRFVRLEGDILKGDRDATSSDVPRQPWCSIAMAYGHEEGDYKTDEGCEGWNAFKDYGSKFIQRVQRAGSCFLHAPAVLQSYCLKGNAGLQVVDISKYARHSFSGEKVSKYIIEDKGGNAEQELRTMIDGERTSSVKFKMGLMDQTKNEYPNELFEQLKLYGPGLIHYFAIEENFKTASGFGSGGDVHLECFEGTFATTKEMQRHAMVLVGMRKVNGEWRLLLQNWWPNLQLVEVTPEYMASSGCFLVFVTKELWEIPCMFDRCDHEYAEAYIPGTDSTATYIYERD
ncbi:expressed unknown protein [Seminavis robusta]|uniref:Uncharacterized protein n=1 Tax=Seminavis robusta TaxID=568900 RepID=A0A9N8E5J9_9STRA|nr:expressed unknown protein [Seminavis robusta]|eukprot:Sro684_g186840.1 n/a (442) ;mRNA; r:44841-46166